jgi:hypothetical protein
LESLGEGLGAPGFHELPEGVVRLDKLLAASLPAAFGIEKIAGIGTFGGVR